MAQPDPALVEAVRRAEALMLEIRKNPARHGELKDQQKAVQAARNALAAATSAS